MAKRKRKPTVKPTNVAPVERPEELAGVLVVPFPPKPEQFVTSIGDGSETELKPAPPPATRVETHYRLGPHGSGWRVVSTYRGDRLISEQLFAHFANQEK